MPSKPFSARHQTLVEAAAKADEYRVTDKVNLHKRVGSPVGGKRECRPRSDLLEPRLDNFGLPTLLANHDAREGLTHPPPAN